MFEHNPKQFTPKELEPISFKANKSFDNEQSQRTFGVSADLIRPPEATEVRKVILSKGKVIDDHFIVKYDYTNYHYPKENYIITALTSYHMVVASKCEYTKDNLPMTLTALDVEYWNNPLISKEAIEVFLGVSFNKIQENIHSKKYSLIYLTNLYLRPLSAEEKDLREKIRSGYIVL